MEPITDFDKPITVTITPADFIDITAASGDPNDPDGFFNPELGKIFRKYRENYPELKPLAIVISELFTEFFYSIHAQNPSTITGKFDELFTVENDKIENPESAVFIDLIREHYFGFLENIPNGRLIELIGEFFAHVEKR